MMNPIVGFYTLKVVTSPHVISTLNLEIMPNHEASCPQLGQGGRYYANGAYILIAFGDTDNFNGETYFAIFAKIAPHNPKSFKGIMLDYHTGQRFGCEAQVEDFMPETSFGNFDPLPTWPGYEFTGLEQPYNDPAYYRFNYSANQTEKVTIGIIGREPSWTGPGSNWTYPADNEELLVFGTNALITYGAVVDRSNNDIQLKEGMYMNPFNGQGTFDTWEASLKAVSV